MTLFNVIDLVTTGTYQSEFFKRIKKYTTPEAIENRIIQFKQEINKDLIELGILEYINNYDEIKNELDEVESKYISAKERFELFNDMSDEFLEEKSLFGKYLDECELECSECKNKIADLNNKLTNIIIKAREKHIKRMKDYRDYLLQGVSTEMTSDEFYDKILQDIKFANPFDDEIICNDFVEDDNSDVEHTDDIQKEDKELDDLFAPDIDDDYEEDSEENEEYLNIRELCERFLHRNDVPSLSKSRVRELLSQIKDYKSNSTIESELLSIVKVPWNKYRESKKYSNKEMKKMMDESLYKLDKVKDKIIQYVSSLKFGYNQGKVLCLVGNPGTGKTSIAQILAKCLDRDFVEINLSGVSDVFDIKGFSSTYTASQPGLITREIIKAKSCNPIIFLDEAEKAIGRHGASQIHNVLLELLDPKQNSHFVDTYLKIPLDLSKAIFVLAANDVSLFPQPLIDRLDIVYIPDYTKEEKYEILKNYLIPNQMLSELKGKIEFEDSALWQLVNSTFSGGIREIKYLLEDVLGNLYRKIVDDIEEKEDKISNNNTEFYIKKLNSNIEKNGKIIIKKEQVKEILKDKTISIPTIDLPKEDSVGYVNGLAFVKGAPSVIVPIEVVLLPEGSGKTTITGLPGEVMKESVKVAQTVALCALRKNNILVSPDKYDIHIHFPEGGIKKDGPSAGAAIAAAIYSAYSNKKIRSNIAMTGEVSLSGKILPIGAVNEKISAAKNTHINKIIIPKNNTNDVNYSDKDLEIISVSNFDDVLKLLIVE